MSIHRYNPRRDSNERDIVAALKQAGCRVIRSDVFDLIVQRGLAPPHTFLLEVKTQDGNLNQKQLTRRDTGWIFSVVRTVDEALKAVGIT